MVDILIFGGLLLTFALTSRKLERIWIGAPIAFVIAGFLVVEFFALLSIEEFAGEATSLAPHTKTCSPPSDSLSSSAS